MNNTTDFFVVGGTLRPDSESYVVRPADEELFKFTQEEEFCYILTPRQMGKSSLMLRTARRLQQTGRQTAAIDLTGIGTGIIAEKWYSALLTELKNELHLEVNVAEWWQARQGSPAHRFIEFFHDVLLVQVTVPITICIDEIDVTLGLDFSDDFFAAIRFMYNARASDPIYKRLTFVLLGVATPDDLIKDPKRTPFNIGYRIDLREFSRTEAQVLTDGLEQRFPGQGADILDWILYWTNGHPYLTQKLCLAAVAQPITSWSSAKVDELVKINLFTDEARKDTNLKFVQNGVESRPLPERRRMLELYQRVYRGKKVATDERSLAQNYLTLFGLVRAEKGRLHVRNEIYRRVFDQAWINETMPVQRQQRFAIFFGIIATLLVAYAGYLIFSIVTQTPANIQAEICTQDFRQATSDSVRLADLACLFRLGAGYDEQARRLFYELPPEGEKNLLLDPQIVGTDLVTVVRGVYVSLDQMDNNHDETLMDAMLQVLKELPPTDETAALIGEISQWKKGRELADQKQFEMAIVSFDRAIKNNTDDTNPVVHYDRAMAYIKLQQYGLALADLERIIIIAKMAPPTPTPTPTQSTPTPTHTPTTTDTATSTPSATPEKTPSPLGQPDVTVTTLSQNPVSPEPDYPRIQLPVESADPTEVAAAPLPIKQLRFISTNQIIETVGELLGQVQELRTFLQNNPDSYPQLVILFIPSIARETPGIPPTNTPTPTLGPTLLPVETLRVVNVDNFSSDKTGWDNYPGDVGSTGYEDGRYFIEVNRDVLFLSVWGGAGVIDEGVLQVEILGPFQKGGASVQGLSFGWQLKQPDQPHYSFSVSAQGSCRFSIGADNSWIHQTFQRINDFNKEKPHTLAVVITDGQAVGYVDGEFCGQLEIPNYKPGFVGAVASSPDGKGKSFFDNYKIYKTQDVGNTGEAPLNPTNTPTRLPTSGSQTATPQTSITPASVPGLLPIPSFHTIQENESLSTIIVQYGLPFSAIDAIRNINNLSENTILRPGQILQLPSAYEIQPNDTLSDIALKFNISIDDLKRANKLNSDTIFAGNILILPVTSSTPTPTNTPSVTQTPTSSPEPTMPTGNLAIPVVFNFGTKVYLTDFDGVGINSLNEISIGGVPGSEDARQPMFSRDGKSLIVKATINGINGLHKVTASEFNPEIIIGRGSAEWPVLSPDGQTVMFSESTLDYRLHKRLPSDTIETDDALIEEVALNGFPILARNLLWSEDNRLVFKECAVWKNLPGECGTWITNASNLDPQRIIVANDAQPMSIRGGLLAYMFRETGKDWDIFIMSIDDGKVTEITNNDFEDGLPAISPDGNAVAYISNESGGWGLWTVDLDGQNKRHWFDIDPSKGVFDTDKWDKDRMSWRR